MTKDEEIEEFAVAALQLSQYLFMHLVDRNIIDPTEANQWLEQGIKLNSQGTEPHKKAAEIFDFFAKVCGGPGRRLQAYEISVQPLFDHHEPSLDHRVHTSPHLTMWDTTCQ